jgi:hypothetical protein
MDATNLVQVGGVAGGVITVVLIVYRLIMRQYRSSSCTSNASGVVVSLSTSSAKAPSDTGNATEPVEAKESK